MKDKINIRVGSLVKTNGGGIREVKSINARGYCPENNAIIDCDKKPYMTYNDEIDGINYPMIGEILEVIKY